MIAEVIKFPWKRGVSLAALDGASNAAMSDAMRFQMRLLQIRMRTDRVDKN